MNMGAVEAVDDAVETTQQFLFPFSLVRWAKLALLVVLMSGGAGLNASVPAVPNSGLTPMTSGGGMPPTPMMDGGVPAITPVASDVMLTPALVAAVAVLALVGVFVVTVVSVSLRLVFYRALQTGAVRVWRPFVTRLGQAVGLVVFTGVLTLALILPAAAVAVALAPVRWGPVAPLSGAITSLPPWAVAVLGVAFGVVALVVIVALRITNEFVVPVMIIGNVGVFDAWRQLWSPLRASWTALLPYLVVHFIISLGISIIEGLSIVFGGGLIAVGAGAVLLLAASGLGGVSALTGTALGVVILVFIAVVALALFLGVLLPVRLLTRTYQIAYEVSTLSRLAPEFTLVRSGREQ